MAEKKEDRDTLIAFIVGGAVLVLIFLYLFGGTHGNAQTTASGDLPPSVTTTPASDQTPYTYNIAPYNPDPGLEYGASPFNPGGAFGGGGCGCGCGPTNGQQYNKPGIAQFMTLLGFGNAGGAG